MHPCCSLHRILRCNSQVLICSNYLLTSLPVQLELPWRNYSKHCTILISSNFLSTICLCQIRYVLEVGLTGAIPGRFPCVMLVWRKSEAMLSVVEWNGHGYHSNVMSSCLLPSQPTFVKWIQALVLKGSLLFVVHGLLVTVRMLVW